MDFVSFLERPVAVEAPEVIKFSKSSLSFLLFHEKLKSHYLSTYFCSQHTQHPPLATASPNTYAMLRSFVGFGSGGGALSSDSQSSAAARRAAPLARIVV